MLPVVRTSSIRSFIRFRQRSSVDLPQPGRADQGGDLLAAGSPS